MRGVLVSLKDSYDSLKTRYSVLSIQMAGLIGKKEMMEGSLAKVNQEIGQIVGVHSPDAVVSALSKEIETRLELLRTDIEKYEGMLREFKLNSSKVTNLDDLLGE